MKSDQLKFYEWHSNSTDSFRKICPVCSKRDHSSEKCSLISYLPDRDFLIKKLNNSIFQNRSKRVKFARLQKFNALKDLHSIQTNALKLDLNEENDSGVSSDENDLLLSEKLRRRDQRKRMSYINKTVSKKEISTSENEGFEKEKEKEKEKVVVFLNLIFVNLKKFFFFFLIFLTFFNILLGKFKTTH